MLKFKSLQKALVEERRKNEQLQAELLKAKSDIDYIAMMNDVELEIQQEETEVNDNE